MPTPLRAFGDRGELLAADYLRKKGYEIVERNFLTREGEIDLITRIGTETVFIEVKTRKGKTFGEIPEAITPEKEEKLLRTIEQYLEATQLEDSDWRADVLTVDFSVSPPAIEHFENAFA